MPDKDKAAKVRAVREAASALEKAVNELLEGENGEAYIRTDWLETHTLGARNTWLFDIDISVTETKDLLRHD